MDKMRIIGVFSDIVIQILDLDVEPGTPIFIGPQNERHIETRHPYEYELYFSEISDIIKNPTYVGVNPHDDSVGFVKEYEISGNCIRVAVRIDSSGRYIARSLHLLSSVNVEHYIAKGFLRRLT